jgi:hypothetical protein
MFKTQIRSLVVLAGVTAATLTNAATVVMFDVDDKGKRAVKAAYIENNKVLLSDPGGVPYTEVLYEHDTDRFVIINHKDKSWLILNRAKVDSMSAQAEGIRSTIADNLSADQQEQLSGMLANIGMEGFSTQQPSPEKEYVNTNEMRAVNGFNCSVFRVMKAGQPDTEICVATGKLPGMPVADYQTLQAMYVLSDYIVNKADGLPVDIGATLPDLGGGKIGGLPVRVTDIDDAVTVTLRKVTQQEINPARMSVPSGYEETALPGL